jgi:hypothetical protein
MHKYLHEGTKIKNMETYQTLACSLSWDKSQKIGQGSTEPGILKVAEQKEPARLLLEAHSGKDST